jgi:hypothetical protein
MKRRVTLDHQLLRCTLLFSTTGSVGRGQVVGIRCYIHRHAHCHIRRIIRRHIRYHIRYGFFVIFPLVCIYITTNSRR